MNGSHPKLSALLIMSSLLGGSQLFAAEGERDVAVEINKANGLLRSGDVDAALKTYGQVQNSAPDRADLSYNMAVAQYRKGDVAAAEKLFNQAAGAENDAVAANARYNLGNCNYAAALKTAESDHPAAIKGLATAIENYRRALEIDPNDADSRANIELAAAMIDKLREQDKKQQQQQNQQQDQKQHENKDKKESKQENNKQQDSQDKKDSQQQGKNQQQSQQKQQQKPDPSQEKKSQGKPSSQNQQQNKQDENSQKNPSGDTPEPKAPQQNSKPEESKSEQKDSKSPDDKQPSNSQNQSQTKQDKPQDNSASEKQDHRSQQQAQSSSKQNPKEQQQRPDESKQAKEAKDQPGKAAPKGTLSAAQQNARKADPQGKEFAGQPEVVPEGAMTIQEAEKMLQAIRDQEMIRRLKRQAAERNQHVPVDRDW